jgi:hypothetical protein
MLNRPCAKCTASPPGPTRFFSLACFGVLRGAVFLSSAIASLIAHISSFGVPLPLPIAMEIGSTRGTQAFLFETDAERGTPRLKPKHGDPAGMTNAASIRQMLCMAQRINSVLLAAARTRIVFLAKNDNMLRYLGQCRADITRAATWQQKSPVDMRRGVGF